MRFLRASTLTFGKRALDCETGAAQRARGRETGAARRTSGRAERGSRRAFYLSACAARWARGHAASASQRARGREARANWWEPGCAARAVRSNGWALRPGMRAHRRDARECAVPLAPQAAFWLGEGEHACACAVRRAFRESRYRATLSLLGWSIKKQSGFRFA